METKKTYSLKTSLLLALAAALVITCGIFALSPLLARFQATLLPDAGAAWYYWKLPHPELWASVTMWVGYAAHQVAVWWLIVRLRRQPLAPKGRIGRTNLALLVVNLLFVLLHLAQTVLFYDALAQFVPVWSSQGSVIVMLVMILILLNSRRGLFFGKKAALPPLGVSLVQKTHGFYIAWAIVYTFWFHPMEATLGHLLGFFYFFLLLIQLSLARTSWHVNIRWITVLEVFVAFHGAVVAILAGNGMWPMFFFGFMMMFLVTQMYGVIKNRVAIAGVFAGYAALMLAAYGGLLRNVFTGTPVGWGDIHQIFWIPVILYALVFALVWLLQGVGLLLKRKPKA